MLETGFSFTPASAPGLFVHEKDFDRAGELLEQFSNQPGASPKGTWICPHCGESVEEQFDVCWNCETPRGCAPLVAAAERPDEAEEDDKTDAADETVGESPSDDVPLQRSMWGLWTEVIVVLSFMWIARFLVRSMIRIAPRWDTDLFFAEYSMWNVVYLASFPG